MLLRGLMSAILGVGLLAGTATAYDYTDNQPWSQMPPANLRPVQVPLFVSIGFDDNRSSEGMNWIVNYMRNLQNPTGTNATTFDGAPARVSFYYTGDYITGNAREPIAVKKAWRDAWLDGHEAGNHTMNHPDGGPDGEKFTEAQWEAEIMEAQSWLTKPFDPNEVFPDDTKGPGFPVTALKGFRTPYLDYNNNLFPVLKRNGFVYDTSIEEGWDSQFNGTNNPWPYTLDNGTPTVRVNRPPVGSYPGLWQLPANVFQLPEGGKMVGFDTNMWVGKNMRKADVLAILKHNLHLRLQGNRSPLLYGAHSGIYTIDYDSGGRASNFRERQEAIEEFLQYALNLEVNGKKVVRVVPFEKIIDWMRNPQPVIDGHVVTVESKGAGPVYQPGTIYYGGDQVYYNGQPWEAKWYASTAPGELPADQDPWKLLTWEQATKLEIMGSVTPKGDTYGDVLIEKNTSKTFVFTPTAGNKVVKVVVNGQDLGPITEYTFSNMTGNETLMVEFGPQ